MSKEKCVSNLKKQLGTGKLISNNFLWCNIVLLSSMGVPWYVTSVSRALI